VPRPFDEVVHAVETAQECRFAATGWADEGQHGLFGYLQRDVKERLGVAVPEAKVADLEAGAQLLVHVRLSADESPIRHDGGVRQGGHHRSLPIPDPSET